MKRIVFAPALALLISLAGFSSAFAAGKDDGHGMVLHLSGASPTLNLLPPSESKALADYDYTNHGTGTLNKLLPVQWQYDEKGSIITRSSSVVHSAEYDVEPSAKPSAKLALHVIPSTIKIHYDNQSTAPCSTGSFTERIKEGAEAKGTFAPLVTAGGCMPTYSLDLTIESNSEADRAFRSNT
ncbi:MAG: hypothetical protein JO247_13535 [Chloroflexi bacterium]|nr:hypothetical protein [Chloroflexota bacterium]